MGSTTLTPSLIAQLAQQGITIVGDPFLQDGQTMVAIEDDNAAQSRVVTLASLTGCDNTHFNTPGVFRPAPAVAACSSSSTSSPCHEYSLDVSQNPINPDGTINVEAIVVLLRQIASGDRDQAQAGLDALNYARQEARSHGREAEFDEAVAQAQARIAVERPSEAPRVEESYRRYEQGTYQVPQTSTLPPSPSGESGSTGSGSAGGGAQGAGGGSGTVVVASQGTEVVPSANGTVAPIVGLENVGASNGMSGLTVASAGAPIGLDEGDEPVVGGRREPIPTDDDVAAVSVPVAVPVPYSPPVDVTIPNPPLPAMVGSSMIPGNGSQFFQSFFGPEGSVSSPIARALTSSDPSLWFFQEATRDAVSRALREMMRDPSSPQGQGTLTFRSNPERGGVEIFRTPSREPSFLQSDPRLGVRGEDDGRLGEDVSGLGRFRSSFGTSLALFPLGQRLTDSASGNPIFVPYLPLSQTMPANRRFGEGQPGLMAHANGVATDRAPERADRRGDPRRDGEGRGRDSHGGGQGDQRDRRDDEEVVASIPDDEASAHAA